MRRTPAAGLLTLALLGLTACSGEDTLSKEEFITQGDEICSQLETDSEAVTVPTEQEGFAPYLNELASLAKQAQEDFAALTPPEDGEEVQTALVDALDTATGTVEEAADAAESGDIQRAGELAEQAGEEASVADQQAQDYGFQECGG